MKLNGAKAVVEALKDENAFSVFGIPGGANLPLYDELQKDGNITHIHMRHEQGAAHAAEGFARVLGKVGVCIGTSGPGATNLVTGIADAFMDSVPVVALTGQVPAQLLGKDAFQEVDIFGITMPITKHNFRIAKSEESYSTVREAFAIALKGRPGPVLVDLPKNLQIGEFELDKKNFSMNFNYREPIINREKIKKAAEMLLNADRPMILAGGGVTIANAGPELTKLAETLLCYAATTITARGAIPTDHPFSLGQIGMHGRQVTNHAIANCDVLLAVGTRFSDRITGDVKAFAPHAKIIHIDIDPSEIGKNVNADLAVIADAKAALRELLQCINEMNSLGKGNLWGEKIKQLNRDCNCNIWHDESPIRPETIMKELNKALPEDIIVTTEVGHHQMFATHFLRVHNPRHFLTSAGLGTMGFGLPAAIGCKVAKPNNPVIDIAGDGSLIMVCQEMATSVEHNLPVSIALVNNGWYAIVKEWQHKFYGGRYLATNLGKSTDFVKLAESFGGRGIRVEKPSEINDAIRQSLDSGKLFLVDIITNPDGSGIPLVPPLGKNTEMILAKQCPIVSGGYFNGSKKSQA